MICAANSPDINCIENLWGGVGNFYLLERSTIRLNRRTKESDVLCMEQYRFSDRPQFHFFNADTGYHIVQQAWEFNKVLCSVDVVFVALKYRTLVVARATTSPI